MNDVMDTKNILLVEDDVYIADIYKTIFTKNGYSVVVAKDGEEIVFVEVKTRKTITFGPPESAIHPQKFRRMVRCAHAYLKTHCLEASPWRIDVVAITMLDGKQKDIQHYLAIIHL